MTGIGKVWTAGIAYVALAVGAGLSIMYNILDTMQVRGAQFDWADLVTAVAAPAIVLLMVEMFVSRIWVGQPWPIQVIRWLATLAIGGVAMRTSWTHGHDFMASRGQAGDVAMLWPLAIDLLAIMATALILAGRTRGHVATVATPMATVANQAFVAMAKEIKDGHDPMAKAEQDGQAMATTWDDDGHGHEAADCPDTPATQPMSEEYMATLKAEIEAWSAGGEQAITDAGRELATEAEAFLEPVKTFANTVPSHAVDMIKSWDGKGDPKAFDQAVAQRFGKSARTARRWRSLVTGAPTSGA